MTPATTTACTAVTRSRLHVSSMALFCVSAYSWILFQKMLLPKKWKAKAKGGRKNTPCRQRRNRRRRVQSDCESSSSSSSCSEWSHSNDDEEEDDGDFSEEEEEEAADRLRPPSQPPPAFIMNDDTSSLGPWGRAMLSAPAVPYLTQFRKCLEDPCMIHAPNMMMNHSHPMTHHHHNNNNIHNPTGYIPLCVAENRLVLDLWMHRFLPPPQQTTTSTPNPPSTHGSTHSHPTDTTTITTTSTTTTTTTSTAAVRALTDPRTYGYHALGGLPLARDAVAYFLARRFLCLPPPPNENDINDNSSNNDNDEEDRNHAETGSGGGVGSAQAALDAIQPRRVVLATGAAALINHLLVLLGGNHNRHHHHHLNRTSHMKKNSTRRRRTTGRRKRRDRSSNGRDSSSEEGEYDGEEEGGDCCLIPAPYYAAFDNHCQLVAGVTPWSVHSTNPHLGPTRHDLDRAYQSARANGLRPRFLLVTNPNNPLGVIYTPSVMHALVDWARAHHIHTIVDELYALSVHQQDHDHEDDSTGFQSILRILKNDLGADVHHIYALSKDFGMAGWRVGMLYTHNEALLQALHRCFNLFTCVSGPVQYLVAECLTDDAFVDAFVQQSRSRLRDCYQVVSTKLEEMVLPYIPAAAGMFVYVDFSSLLPPPPRTTTTTTQDHEYENEEEEDRRGGRRRRRPQRRRKRRQQSLLFAHERALANVLFKAARIVLTPGESQHDCHPGWFRLCYGWVSMDVLELALERLSKLVSKIRRMDWDDLLQVEFIDHQPQQPQQHLHAHPINTTGTTTGNINSNHKNHNQNDASITHPHHQQQYNTTSTPTMHNRKSYQKNQY